MGDLFVKGSFFAFESLDSEGIYTIASFRGPREMRETLTITALLCGGRSYFLSDVGFGSSVNSDR
ncbi:hypothetical protein V7O67_00455 [Methanolobus sp. ZRKC4]|uniref:hypothetical protein n=1 Tax=Methanolobus sp. ZRKC4 TaxID=3125787 RepID=UPI0032483B0E